MRNLGVILVVLFATPAGAVPAWYGTDLQRDLPAFSEEEAATIAAQCEAQGQQGTQGEDGLPEEDEPSSERLPPDGTHETDPQTDPVGPAEVPDAPEDEWEDIAEASGDTAVGDEAHSDDANARVGIEGPRPPDFDREPPSWWTDFIEWLGQFEGTGVDLSEVLKALAIAALVAVLFFVLGLIYRVVRRVEMPERTPPPANALDALRQITGSKTHDVHASTGDFDIAIHALLLDALVKLAPHFPIIESASTTGREVAKNVEPEPGPLTALVRLSEASIFALVSANAAQYERAQALHAEILRGLR